MELLSLQQSCMLALIFHLDRIPPEALRLLPRGLRLELLSYLPPADVCFLESTAVVHGLDLDGVWKKLYERCSLRRIARALCWCSTRSTNRSATAASRLPCICQSWEESNHRRDSNDLSWRECFVHVLSSLILSFTRISFSRDCRRPAKHKTEHCQFNLDPLETAYRILFTGHLGTLHDRSRCDCNGHFIKFAGYHVRPERMLHHLSLLVTNKKDAFNILVKKMITDFNMFPVILCINNTNSMASYYSTEKFLCRDSTGDITKSFLEKVKTLKLCFKDRLQKHSSALHILKCATAYSTTKLESLIVRIDDHDQPTYKPTNDKYCTCGQPSLTKSILLSIAPLLAPPMNDWNQDLQLHLKTKPFLCLKNLEVSCNYRLESSNFQNAVSVGALMHIVTHQKNLESLTVSGWWGWSPKVPNTTILSQFCSSFFSQSVSLIHLKDLDVPFPLVQKLLRSFLDSPPGQQQTFVMQSVWIYDEPDNIELQSLTTNCTCDIPLQHHATGKRIVRKSLHFLSMHISNEFLAWLSTVPSLHIKHLELSDIQYDPDMRPGGLIGIIENHCNSHVENVAISTILLSYCPSEAFDVL